MISNDADKGKCVACEEPKPGSKPAPKPDTKMSGNPNAFFAPVTNSGFSFGSSAGNNGANNGGGFTFSAPKTNNTLSGADGDGFKFGTGSPAASASPAASEFTFGAANR